MRKLLFCALACLVSATAHAGPVTTLDDVTNWVGSGANRAAIAIDWDGDSTANESLVWGYRWDGTATGWNMLEAIVTAEPRLFAKIEDYGGSLGVAIYGLGYDDGDGNFAVTDGTVFNPAGIADSAPADGGAAVDPGDLYAEGWFTGFWHYGVATGDPYNGGSWSSSNWGASSRQLLDGSWDSWAFTPSFNFQAFASNPVNAVPEPSTWILTLAAVSALLTVRGKRFVNRAPLAAGLLALVAAASNAEASPFATQVISYTPGNPVGVANPAPYQTDGSQAIGSPSRDTQFNSQVGVFYPAFGAGELVIVGAGGQLTVAFDHPVENDPANPFGMDLLVFGNAFYVINPQQLASGTFEEPGRVSVSQECTTWFDIPGSPADTVFPTLGYTNTVYSGFGNSGGTIPTDFTRPVDRSFSGLGKTEAQINAGYAGSGGGTGIDIGLVGLDWIQYVRVWQPETDDWSTEIDGFADVSPVPEPASILLAASAALGFLALRRRQRVT